MPPRLAAILCWAYIAYLFRDDLKKRDQSISWVPFVWMFLAGSRWVSSWLSMSAPMDADALSEGSPVDRAAFSVLIFWGLWVLSQRRVKWGRLLMQNKIVIIYLLYCLASVLWTNEPFMLVKRWFKDLGNPIMALVILTEEKPFEALGITLRRLAFIFLPLSVLYVKYFPDLGRGYHNDGSPMYTGIGHQKNDLGLMCLTAGMYFAWKILQKRDGKEQAEKPNLNDYALIAMLAWLLQKSDSQTSFACLMTTIGLMIVARLPLISSKTSRLVTVSVLGSLTYIVLDATIEIRATILALLGRDPTLTSRTDIWRVLWQFQGDPIIGVGFMSFWTGQRLKDIWEACACQINQAHNGYIEQFLNLGYVGVGLMVGIMVNGLNNVRARLNHDRAGSLIRFCFIVVTALYNYTEASFYGISNIYVLALIGCLDTEGITERKAVESAAQAAIAPAPAAAGLVTQPTIFVSPYRAGRTGVTRQTAAR